MHFTHRNCNTAFFSLVQGIHEGSIRVNVGPSRNGEVLQIEEPVTITYTEPRERVLFNEARDCNPFFHVYETLWMLAGRRDIAPLDYYSGNYSKQVKDGESPYANGAYGYRWQHSQDVLDTWNEADKGWRAQIVETDQLPIIIDHLRRKPESRRVVLDMWSVKDDLLKIDSSKDVCCNLNALFSIEDNRYVNMTVFNRSNDLIWGSLGANVVHFSFLQEYVASRLGLECGRYHQISNNLHVYSSNWKPALWLHEETRTMHSPPIPVYGKTVVPCEHRVGMTDAFDAEVNEFVEINKNFDDIHGMVHWNDPFLDKVAQPMCHAFHMHKQRDYEAAMEHVNNGIQAQDWRIACRTWINKRMKNFEAKERAGDASTSVDQG